MRVSFRIGRLFGIPVRVTPSWFITLALTVVLLAVRVYAVVLPEAPMATSWLLAVATAVLFFLGILLHELGHALVARRLGVPVRGITLFLLGGLAQIAHEMRSPLTELAIAAAGPAVSLLLAGLFFVLAQVPPAGQTVSLALDTSAPLHPGHLLHVLWTALWLLNLSLAVFNLVPGFPMDGGRLLRALLWLCTRSYRLATRIAGWVGQAIALALIAFGIATLLGLRGKLFDGGALTGAWLVLVGGYLFSATRATAAMERALDTLRGYRARELARSDVPIVSAAASLLTLLPALLAAGECDTAFVVEEAPGERQRVVGLLGRDAALLLPVAQRGRILARQVMLPATGIRPAPPEEDGVSLLRRLEAEGLPAVPVVASDNEVLGVVSWRTLARVLERR